MDRAKRLVDHDVHELARMLRSGETTAVALTQAYLDRIDRFNGPFETFDANGGYNAFVRIDRDEALEQAREVDDLLQKGEPLPLLAGIPIGIKDSIAIRGRLSTNGLGVPPDWALPTRTLFDGNIAVRDAAVVAKLRAQKAVILGHTTCSELSQEITGIFAGNAWDMRYAAGGSSQGSGVAPMARLAAAAIGVETGGSIVFPAAANGASAIKPAPGTVSVSGVMMGQAGMDVPGPMTRSVRDAALILNALYDHHSNPTGAGSDASPASLFPTEPSERLNPSSGVRIGLPKRDWMYRLGVGELHDAPWRVYDDDFRDAFIRLTQQLVQLGAAVEEFDNFEYHAAEYDEQEIAQTPGQTSIKVGGVIYGYNALMLRQAEDQRAFASTRPPEQSNMLRARLGSDYLPDIAQHVTFQHRVIAEGYRRRLRARYQQSLEDHNIDFMLVLPLGTRLDPRFTTTGLRLRRSFQSLPNLLGWSMVTFPIGMTDGDSGPGGAWPRLPITAAFWGPASAESLMIQTAIDFQHRFPQYHNEIPDDPTEAMMRECVRPSGVPRISAVTRLNVDGLWLK